MTEATERGPRFARLGESDPEDLRAELAHEHDLRVRAHVAMDRMAALVAEEHERRTAAEAQADELRERMVAAEDEADALRRVVQSARLAAQDAGQEAHEALRELEGIRTLNDLTLETVSRRRRVLQRARHVIGR